MNKFNIIYIFLTSLSPVSPVLNSILALHPNSLTIARFSILLSPFNTKDSIVLGRLSKTKKVEKRQQLYTKLAKTPT